MKGFTEKTKKDLQKMKCLESKGEKNMKKKILGVLTVSVLTAAVCAAPVWAKGGSTFVYGTTGYGVEMGDEGLNPHYSYSGWSAIRYGVGETLFKYNDNMEIEPWLAEGYEFVDDKTVKITLREGIQFSSGRTMDGEAVKECLEHLTAVHDRAAGDLKIDHIEAKGMTVTIYTEEPCPSLIHYLGDPYGAIIDMAFGREGVEGDTNGTANVAGTGPYIAKNVTETQIDLVKNENYWGGEVNVDNVVVKTFGDASSLAASLQTGDIQGTYGLAYDSYALFEGNPEYAIWSCATSRCFFGQFNFDSEIMQEEAVRKAITMGIDKEGFCSVLMNGRGIPADAAFPDSFSYGNKAVTVPGYDPEGAKEILKDAGWKDTDGDGYLDKDGQKLSVRWLTYPGRLELPKLAEYAQATLKEIGIEVDVNCTSDYNGFLENGGYDVYVSSLTTAPTGDPEYFFTTCALENSVKNRSNHTIGDVEALYRQLHSEFESEKRGELAVLMQQAMLDESAVFFVSHLNMGIVTKANVTGIGAHPCDYYEITADLKIEEQAE